MVRRVGALLGLALVLCASTATRAEVANRECDNDQDVTIVVDFQSLGGGVNVRCAPQPIKNGFDVFRRANVSYETVSGSDFVCRIAGKPGAESEDCVGTPPGDAYWTYWYAKRGEDWTYSSLGPGARKPPPGSFEGWSFDSGDAAPRPRYAVPAPFAAPTTTATSTASTQPAASPPTPPTTGERSSRPSAATTPLATVVLTTVQTPGTSTTTSIRLGSVDLSVDSGGGGTSAGFVLSLLAVTGLAAAAFLFLRLRGR